MLIETALVVGAENGRKNMSKSSQRFQTSSKFFQQAAFAHPEWRLNPSSFADHQSHDDAVSLQGEILRHGGGFVTIRDALDYLDIRNTAAAENAPDDIDTDVMYEDACASACGF